MSGSDLVMDSEKEETVETANHPDVQVQREEIIPGSSPEGVFQDNEQQVFEQLEPQHEQLEEHEQAVEGQVQNGELIGEDGQHYQEGHQFMNMVQITQEDVYEAGFDCDDLNALTEEQLNHIVAISQQKKAQQGGNEQQGGHHHIIQFDDGNGGVSMLATEGEMMVQLNNDGGIIITDANQQEYYISSAVIENLNIDINNIEHEQVQQLVQIVYQDKNNKPDVAGYNVVEGEPDQQPSTSYQHNNDQLGAETGQNAQLSMNRPVAEEHRNPMIGETVQIRTADGRLQDAVVKYVRGNSEFKIQFMDGEFAYATMDQMLMPHRGREHENYQVAAPMLIRRTDMARMSAQKRAASASEDLCPPVLKRSFHFAPIAEGPHSACTPNFSCPICDKKVFQKEPSYIVIRLPACDACTREKIIVLDEQNQSS